MASKLKQDPNEVTEENENYFRLQLLRGKLEDTIKNKFHKHFPVDPCQLYAEFQKHKPRIEVLFKKKRINKGQYALLIPTHGGVYSDKFDASLLFVLLEEFCGYKINGNPKESNRTDNANFGRTRKGRNMIQHAKPAVSKHEFLIIFDLLKPPLVELGANSNDLEKLKNIPIMNTKTKERMKNLEKAVQSNISLHHNYIPPVKNFFSREKELEKVHSTLVKLFGDMSNPVLGVVLAGFGGVGKSQSAKKYWQQYSKTYYEDIIIWINGHNTTTIENDFFEIGEQCGVRTTTADGNRPIKEIVHEIDLHFATMNNGNTARKVLFVFDNVNNKNDIESFLPTSKNHAPHILITSQCTDWDSRFEVIALEVFSDKTALKFLENNLREQLRNTQDRNLDLVRLLGGHPLTIQQAISYMNKNGFPVCQYLTLFQKRKRELLSEEAKEPIFTTFSLALQNLEEIGDVETALLLLNVMSRLNGKNIQKGLLLLFCKNDIYILNKALDLLQSFSFITISELGESYCDQTVIIHSLSQLILDIKQREQGIYKQTLEDIIKTFFKDLKQSTIKDGKYWFQHFMYMCHQEKTRTEILLRIDKDTLDDLYELFKFKGQLKQLKSLLVSLLQDKQKGPKMLLKMKFCDAKCVLHDEGNPKEAYKLFNEILPKQQEIYPSEHEDVQKTSYSIALCLQRTGKYKEALSIHREVENVRLETLGELHPDYFASRNSIALCLQFSRKHEEAIKIHREVEQVREATLGKLHPDYLASRNNIAVCLQFTNKHDEALEIHHQVEKARKQVLGEHHQSYLSSKNNIALCLQFTGQHKKAIVVHREVEKIRLETLGDRHHDYLASRNNIALCLQFTKKFGDALNIHRQVQTVRSETLGEHHPQCIASKSHIANCLYELGNFLEALEMYRDVVEKVQSKALVTFTKSRIESCQNEIDKCNCNIFLRLLYLFVKQPKNYPITDDWCEL